MVLAMALEQREHAMGSRPGRAGSGGETPRRPFQRLLEAVWLLVLACMVVLPVMPKSCGGEWTSAVGQALRPLSVGHHWVMYAHPSRVERVMRVEAHFADGRKWQVPLAGGSGEWDRDRHVIWQAMVNKGQVNRNLRWFLRGLCVRTARATEEDPVEVVLSRRTRRLRSPSAVQRGEAVWGPWRERVVATERCDRDPAHSAIAEDRGGT